MNQQQATPYKTEPEKPITTYEVEENGDVKITQTVKTTSWWKAREYLTLIRQNQDALEKTKENYSAEFIQKMKNQEKEIEDELALMTPVMEKAEELSKKEYERQRHEGLKANLIKALEDKETNYEWFTNIWMRTKNEVKDPIFKELTADQQSKVLKILARLKRKGA